MLFVYVFCEILLVVNMYYIYIYILTYTKISVKLISREHNIYKKGKSNKMKAARLYEVVG